MDKSEPVSTGRATWAVASALLIYETSGDMEKAIKRMLGAFPKMSKELATKIIKGEVTYRFTDDRNSLIVE